MITAANVALSLHNSWIGIAAKTAVLAGSLLAGYALLKRKGMLITRVPPLASGKP